MLKEENYQALLSSYGLYALNFCICVNNKDMMKHAHEHETFLKTLEEKKNKIQLHECKEKVHLHSGRFQIVLSDGALVVKDIPAEHKDVLDRFDLLPISQFAPHPTFNHYLTKGVLKVYKSLSKNSEAVCGCSCLLMPPP